MAAVTLPPGFVEGLASGIVPDTTQLTQEQKDLLSQMLAKLQTQEFQAANPGIQLRSGTQVNQQGGLSLSGESQTPRQPNMSAGMPPLPAGQAVQGAQGLTSPMTIAPGTVEAWNASQPATSWLSKWLTKETLPVIISSGTGLAGALIQKSAADNATEAQTRSADQALALTDKMYQQDRADQKPYRDLGAFSLGQLGHLTGMPENFGNQAVWESIGGALSRPPGSATPTTSSGSLWQRTTGNTPTINPTQLATTQALPELQTLRDLGATRQSASSFVRMRAPEGNEVLEVDPSEVEMFKAHGARVV